MLLNDEEIEDLIFLYLQNEGWFVVPHSRKKDTMAFEYLCVNRKNEVAAVQVKTGYTNIEIDDYIKYNHKIFLFQQNSVYSGIGSDNVEIIPKQKLKDFLQNTKWLPQSFRNKVDLVNIEDRKSVV